MSLIDVITRPHKRAFFMVPVMLNLTSLNRFQAFGGHLLGSAGIALLSAGLVFLLWYPGLLAFASGVDSIFLILLCVDVVLGPLITLIIFNPQKKELKRDLLIVVLIQLAALLYGLHTVFIARPVYVVFNANRFDLVYANDLAPENLKKVTDAAYRSPPMFGPQWVVARRPASAEARSALLFSALSGGPDLAQSPQYYVPYVQQKDEVVKHVQSLSKLEELNSGAELRINALASKYSAAKIETGFLPLKAGKNDLAVIVNRATGDVLEIVDLLPWK